MQSVLFAMTHFVAETPRYSNISDFMLNTLHWLSLSDHIKFKQIIFAPVALRSQTSSYIIKLFKPSRDRETVIERQTDRDILSLPSCLSPSLSVCLFLSITVCLIRLVGEA